MRVVCPSCGRSYVVGVGQEENPFACSCGATIDPAQAAEAGGESAAGEARLGDEAERDPAPREDPPLQPGAAQTTDMGPGPPSAIAVGLLYLLSLWCPIGPIWAIVWASGQEPARRRHGRNALIIFGVMLALGLVVASLMVWGGTRFAHQ